MPDQVEEAKIIPENWEDIANMRLKLLESEYEECLKAQITTDPEKFLGLENVLK